MRSVIVTMPEYPDKETYLARSGSTFSKDKKYRYELHRIWDQNAPTVLFILLNPSSADDTENDLTTTRCINFAKEMNYGGIYIANLYAYISTNPDELKNVADPVGSENKKYIEELVKKVKTVVYGYGPKTLDSNPEPEWLKELVNEPFCFKKTKEGYPWHPRSIEKTCTFVPFREAKIPKLAKLTLEDLENCDNISKKRIQEENEGYGLAYCANEVKEKSIKKLRDYLLSKEQQKVEQPSIEIIEPVLNCSEFAFISIDSNTSLCYKYPAGKTRKDLMNILVNFFEDSV